MINSETPNNAWTVLETLYALHTDDRVQQMKTKLQSLTKGSSSMEDYTHKAKSLALLLQVAGKLIDDDDFIICLIHGLDSKFDPIFTATNA